MSFKKRKSDLPDNAANQLSEQNDAQNAVISQTESSSDDSDASDLRRQLAAMRAQRDEARAELAASQVENERLRSAALTPCQRCHFHADWTVRVRTMAGQVHTIACPDGPATLIAHIKRDLAQFDPKWVIREQLTLVLPCETSSSSSNVDVMDPALADDRTLASHGVSKGDLLELLLVDMEWSDHSQAIIDYTTHCGEAFDRDTPIDNDEGMLALSWALVNAINPALRSLHFRSGTMPAGGVSILCAALCALSISKLSQVVPRVRKLNFGGNFVCDSEVESVCELMRVSLWLQDLELDECDISTQGVVLLGSALRASNSLRNLNLFYSGSIGFDGFVSISAALRVNTSLQSLDLSGNGIRADGFEALFEALKVNRSLRHLKVNGAEIDSACAAYVADALQLNSSLTSLDLCGNRLGDDGVELISAALRMNSGLEQIFLDENGIGDRGAASFADVLLVNVGLQSSILENNQIGDTGAMALAAALLVNSTLTSCQLSYNQIGDAGAVALGDALCVNSAITTFEIENNQVGLLGAESIRQAQRKNSRLKPIDLRGNPVDS